MIEVYRTSGAESFEASCTGLAGGPEIFQKSVLRLPRALVEKANDELEPLAPPWVHEHVPRLRSVAVSQISDFVARSLAAEGGLCIVSGDGLAALSDDTLACLHLSVAGALGKPVGQNRAGEKLVVVHASQGPGAPGLRGYQSNDNMRPHSDAGDFVGLMCLSQAGAGGTSLFASALEIHDHLSLEAPELLPEYYRDWYWNVGALGFPGVNKPYKSPIFSVCRGRLSCRFGSSLLRDGATAAGETLTDAQVAALDLFEEVALRDGVVARYKLTRGEFVWMNNQRLLHGRDAFSESERTDGKRRLLRAWSRSVTAHKLWPRFAEFDDHLFHALEY
jgi:hypothetical protein